MRIAKHILYYLSVPAQRIKRAIQTLSGKNQKNPKERDDACNDSCNDLISRIEDSLLDAKSIFASPQTWSDPQAETAWKDRNSTVLSDS